jgi:N-terminal region of glycosyl transferase group 7/N-terminal domain of galactosyltransferase/WW domain
MPPTPPSGSGEKDNGHMPLPKGWIRAFSNSQQKYYYSHKETKHTQWHFPTASEASDPWLAKRRVDENEQKMKHQHQQMKRSREHDSAAAASASGASSTSNHKKPRPSDPVAPHSKSPPRPPPGGAAGAGAASAGAATSRQPQQQDQDDDDDLSTDLTSVAIIVPFRDLHVEQKRSQHLSKFIPHMLKFLSDMQSRHMIYDYHIYIVEQSNDERKFNRGKLLNIGFDYARKKSAKAAAAAAGAASAASGTKKKKKHDVFIFHDVDLLPQRPLDETYSRFPTVPHHIARVWDRYSNNPKYFGGIVSFSGSDFKRINGYPNTFWGWYVTL